MLKNPTITRCRILPLILIRIACFAALVGLMLVRTSAQGDPVGPDAVAEIRSATPAVYGCVSGTQAYSTAGGLSNLGDEYLPGNLPDPDESPEAPRNHPMWTQNLYRLANNRFEQIGMGWVKHDDWGSQFNGALCSPEENCCVPTNEVGLVLRRS